MVGAVEPHNPLGLLTLVILPRSCPPPFDQTEYSSSLLPQPPGTFLLGTVSLSSTCPCTCSSHAVLNGASLCGGVVSPWARPGTEALPPHLLCAHLALGQHYPSWHVRVLCTHSPPVPSPFQGLPVLRVPALSFVKLPSPHLFFPDAFVFCLFWAPIFLSGTSCPGTRLSV